jgi:hypothetical protein
VGGLVQNRPQVVLPRLGGHPRRLLPKVEAARRRLKLKDALARRTGGAAPSFKPKEQEKP